MNRDASTGALHGRDAGSAAEFEADWHEALRTADPRWLVYPNPAANDQVSLAEWVKAQQVLAILRRTGRRTGRILEFGCGAAGMTVFLRREGYDCIALDRSEMALAVAGINQRRHDAGGAPLTRVAGDAQALPFADEAFDVVMSYGLLEHFAQGALIQLLRDSVRTLAPGGVFISDVVPGRLNARTVGTIMNFAASALYHVLRGRIGDLTLLWRRYFDHYFENTFSPDEWESLLATAGLTGVQVRVCRPFPPLAVSGWTERVYVRCMRWCMPLWRRFDESRSAVVRAWGWMYLCSGSKPTSGRHAT